MAQRTFRALGTFRDVHPAGGVVVFAHQLQRRVLFAALIEAERAARVESAAPGQARQVRRQALDWDELLAHRLVKARDRIQQA